MSAFWIICANAWMQHPVGYEIRYPDTAFENREDPGLHRYRTERPTFPRVVIYGARR